MNKKFIQIPSILILIFFIGSIFFVSGVTLTKTENGYISIITVPKLAIKQYENGYLGLDLAGYYVNNNPIGRPAIPEQMIRLAIGEKKLIPQVKVTVLESEKIILKGRIHPVQEDTPQYLDLKQRPFDIDLLYYKTPGERQELVSVSEPFSCHGVPGVEITIRPATYNPQDNSVILVKKFQLDITMPEGFNAIPSITSNASHAFVKSIFNNYDVPLRENYRKDPYLILYESQYKENSDFKTFVDFRKELYEVTTVDLKDAGSSGDAVKTYINNLNPKPTYVCFVGNPSKMPHFTGSPKSYWQYSLQSGSDKYSDCFVGMLPVRSASDLTNVVKKTIHTEKNINDYPNQVSLYSTYDGDGHIHREVKYIKDNYWDKGEYESDWQIADNNSSLSASQATANVKKTINDNASKIVCYQGHGSTSGWQHGFKSSDLSKLTNTEVYPFVWGYACQTGAISSSPSFAERWLTAERGACMYTGASVNSGSYQKVLNAGMARATAVEPDLTTIGQIFFYAKHFVFDTTISAPGFQAGNKTQGAKMYNLFGDPALETTEYTTPIINKNASVLGNHLWINGVTPQSISLNIPCQGLYTLEIHSAAGQKIQTLVREKALPAGNQTFQWNTHSLGSGLYLINLTGQDNQNTERFVLLK